MTNDLYKAIKSRVLVLDGAMGTMVQRYKLDEAAYRGERFRDFPYNLKGNNDLLSITRPQVIREIHEAYLEAGADIIETDTFNSNRISLSDYHLEELAYELNVAAAGLARKAADNFTRLDPKKPRWVAGSIGPTSKTSSMSPDVQNPAYRAVSFDDLYDAYREQARGLLDGGADILMVALGTPYQEEWIFQYKDKINVAVIIAVGSGLDFLAGVKKRAPLWMREIGLEWMYRLFQETKRLWKRYLIGIPVFVFNIVLLKVKLMLKKEST